MKYILAHSMPGLRKGAKVIFHPKYNQYYVPKDNYIDFYWFTRHEVEDDNGTWFVKDTFHNQKRINK